MNLLYLILIIQFIIQQNLEFYTHIKDYKLFLKYFDEKYCILFISIK